MRPEYVDDPYEVIDGRFAPLLGDSRMERLFDGCRWAEGPVYFAAGRYLLFSDIPNDRIRTTAPAGSSPTTSYGPTASRSRRTNDSSSSPTRA